MNQVQSRDAVIKASVDEGRRLMTAFVQISCPMTREALVAMVEMFAAENKRKAH